MDEPIVQLCLNLLALSLVAIGGMYVILGEIYRLVVTTGGWMTDADFTALFALAQASPGPNMIFVTLIGWRIGGVLGGLAATLAIMAPALLLVTVVARMWNAWGERLWFVLLRKGLVPLTIGLMASSAFIVANAAAVGWVSYMIVGVSAALMLGTRLHPVVILAGAALVGILGLV